MKGSEMPKRRPIAVVAVLLTAALPLIALQPSDPLESELAGSPRPPDDLLPLEEILDRLTRVADIYDSNALRFTADEVTRVRNLGERRTPPKMRLVNVYSYYRDDDGRLHDKRIRKSAAKGLEKATSIEELARILEAADDPMSERRGLRGAYGVPAFLERPYSWILFFSRDSRKRYQYAVEPSDVSGRVVVRFEPASNDRGGQWHGSVVVDLASYQILRGEGMELEDYEEEQRMIRMLESPEDAPADIDERTFIVRKVSTEFDIQHHGLRFPSTVNVVIDRYRVVGAAGSKVKKINPVATIEQTYRNYRFFEIDVTTDFSGIAAHAGDGDR